MPPTFLSANDAQILKTRYCLLFLCLGVISVKVSARGGDKSYMFWVLNLWLNNVELMLVYEMAEE